MIYINVFIIKDNDEILIVNMLSNFFEVNLCFLLYNCLNFLKIDEILIFFFN